MLNENVIKIKIEILDPEDDRAAIVYFKYVKNEGEYITFNCKKCAFNKNVLCKVLTPYICHHGLFGHYKLTKTEHLDDEIYDD